MSRNTHRQGTALPWPERARSEPRAIGLMMPSSLMPLLFFFLSVFEMKRKLGLAALWCLLRRLK